MIAGGPSPDAAQHLAKVRQATVADLIVMASHSRRGISALVLWERYRPSAHSHRFPVLVCR